MTAGRPTDQPASQPLARLLAAVSSVEWLGLSCRSIRTLCIVFEQSRAQCLPFLFPSLRDKFKLLYKRSSAERFAVAGGDRVFRKGDVVCELLRSRSVKSIEMWRHLPADLSSFPRLRGIYVALRRSSLLSSLAHLC